MTEKNAAHVSVLGGGIAGISIGYYLKLTGIPCTVIESCERPGGVCSTYSHGDFLFDSGSHRFHDRIPEITDEVKSLLGDRLKKVNIPSYIYHKNKMILFPLMPLDLMKKLGPAAAVKIAFEVLKNKIGRKTEASDFRSFAVNAYGETAASLFLLNYSEKLWGKPCEELSPDVSGPRLKGLGLKSVIAEMLHVGAKSRSNLEGDFWYPDRGIGAITDAMSDVIGRDNIRTNSHVTGIKHDGRKITSVVVNGDQNIDVDRVASTLPCDYFIKIMDPAPPADILRCADSIRFRNLLLVALFIDRARVADSVTFYFPDKEFIFTRVYEPKRNDPEMSPPGKTSLVAEIPCGEGDRLWNMADEKLSEAVADQLMGIGWISKKELIDSCVRRIPYAYPMMEKDSAEHLEKIMRCLAGFSNLTIAGRNGLFKYCSMHTLIDEGKKLAEKHRNGL